VQIFKRTALLVTLSVFSLAAWAQGTNQGQGAAPPRNVAPPPADLEPGVNTSATQASPPEPAPAAVPAPTPKSASTPKRAPVPPSAGGSNATPSPTAAPPPGTAGGASAAGTTPASSASPPSAVTAKGAPKTGAAGKAHDSLELDTTQITGNRELPKVLYIVPWKRSDLGDLVGKPVNSLLDEVLTPVDRDVFKRQNRYYDALKPDDAKDAAGAASDPANGKH